MNWKLTWPPLFCRIFFRYLLSVSTMILLMMSKLSGFIPISKTCSLMPSFTQVPKTRSTCSASFHSVTININYLPHWVVLHNKKYYFITVLIFSWNLRRRCCRLRSWSLNAKYLGLPRVSSIPDAWTGKQLVLLEVRKTRELCMCDLETESPHSFIVLLLGDFFRVQHSLELDLWSA